MKAEIIDEGVGYMRVSSPHFCVMPAAAMEITSPHLCVMPAAGLDMFREPLMNISDTEQEFRLILELPGVTKESIQISLKGKLLEIEGMRKAMDDKGTYTHRETVSRTFYRWLKLPEEVDIKRVESKYADGVLEIILPKIASSRIERIRV
jgi:HSP20 family protein